MKPSGVDQFASVARIIAKGEPPQWLVIGLDHFSELVCPDNRTTRNEDRQRDEIYERMHAAADYLIKHLQIFSRAGFSEDVAVARRVLPKIKKLIPYRTPRSGGPRPNILHQVCAAVVVEAWRLAHGKPEPRSVQLLTACNEYWLACGGEYRGQDIENWRRDAKYAAAHPDKLIRGVLSGVRLRYRTYVQLA
jgi:hypothetical protein